MSDNQNLSDRIDVTVNPIEDKDMKLADSSKSAVVNDIYTFTDAVTDTKIVFPQNAIDQGYYSLCFGDSDSGGSAGYYLFKDKTKAFLEVDDTDNTGEIYRIRLLTPDENAASQVTITEENGMFKFSVNGNVDEYPLVEFSQKNGDNWDVLTGVDADVQAIVAAVEALFATISVTDNVLKNVNNLSHGDDVPEYVGTYEGVNIDKLDVKSIEENLVLDQYLTEVATDDIQAMAVSEAKLADDAVTEAKLADDAVTEAKLADDSVTDKKIANEAVSNSKLEKRQRKLKVLDTLKVDLDDGQMYFKIAKDTKLLTAHNADDDSPLKISISTNFKNDAAMMREPLIFFTSLNDGEIDSIGLSDDGNVKSEQNELTFKVDPSLLNDDFELNVVESDSIQLVGEVVYSKKLSGEAQMWEGDLQIGTADGFFTTNADGDIGQLNDGDNFDCYIKANEGTEGGIEPNSLSENTLKLIANSGGGSAGGGLKVIDKLIDSLDPTPLEPNAMYLIAPDEATTDNNVLTLPDGEAGDVVIVLDADSKFKDYPVIVGSDKKIDGFDTITLDMTHCYLEFIFSERRDSWVTRDPLFAPVSLTHARFKR